MKCGNFKAISAEWIMREKINWNMKRRERPHYYETARKMKWKNKIKMMFI